MAGHRPHVPWALAELADDGGYEAGVHEAVLAAALLGGCAVYADPYSGRASAGIFVPSAPAAPVYRPGGWERGRYHERYDGWHRG